MTRSSFIENERKGLSKLINFQLPNHIKKFGIGLLIVSFVALFVNAFAIDSLQLREISKYGMLLGLLIISISKDKIEDELVTKLRMQSYAVAFVVGVAFALAMPFVDYLVDVLLQRDTAQIKDLGDFEILWYLLTVQVLVFESSKKMHN